MPDQSPEAAQLVAAVEDQVRVDVPPLVIFVGLALIETVAAWAAGRPKNSAMPSSIHTYRIRRVLADIRLGTGAFLGIV